MSQFSIKSSETSSGEDSISMPAEFRCPITTDDVMHDPVIAADGHSYERSAIQQLIAIKQTSPKTNAPLSHRELTPNHALKALISDWPPSSNPRNITVTTEPKGNQSNSKTRAASTGTAESRTSDEVERRKHERRGQREALLAVWNKSPTVIDNIRGSRCRSASAVDSTNGACKAPRTDLRWMMPNLVHGGVCRRCWLQMNGFFWYEVQDV
jgi:hypothetical protein